MEFINFLKSQYRISDKSIQTLEYNIEIKTYSNKEIVLHPESSSKYMYFIEEGILRVYYHSNDKDVTLFFNEENQVCLPLESVFYGMPSHFGIQSINKSKIAVLDYNIWKQIISDDTDLLNHQNQTFITNLKRFCDYIYNTNLKTPKEKFDYLMTTNPSLFNKVPLGHISSYLGINQATLSRLRAKK